MAVIDSRPTLIAGPCVAESKALCHEVAQHLSAVCDHHGVNYVFKASFDKANRTSARSYRGPGFVKAMAWLADVRGTYGVPVLTDVHEYTDFDAVAEVVDILQTPALLCRQTDYLRRVALAANEHKRILNFKKGQFMAPAEVPQAVAKVREGLPDLEVWVTERGYMFGYQRLVVDLPEVVNLAATTLCPIVLDCTHAVQMPGGSGATSDGRRWAAPMLARAAVAAGIPKIFAECHPNPDKALSDGPNSIALKDMDTLVQQIAAIWKATWKPA